MSLTIPVNCDKETMKILRRHLDEGTIRAQPSNSFNSFEASEGNHLNIINDWVSDYGNISDENFKRQLRQLKYAETSGKAGSYAIGTINQGSEVTAILVHFSEKRGTMRTYTTMSVHVKLTSECAKDWARRYPLELAVLALSGQSSSYTLRITDWIFFVNLSNFFSSTYLVVPR